MTTTTGFAPMATPESFRSDVITFQHVILWGALYFSGATFAIGVYALLGMLMREAVPSAAGQATTYLLRLLLLLPGAALAGALLASLHGALWAGSEVRKGWVLGVGQILFGLARVFPQFIFVGFVVLFGVILGVVGSLVLSPIEWLARMAGLGSAEPPNENPAQGAALGWAQTLRESYFHTVMVAPIFFMFLPLNASEVGQMSGSLAHHVDMTSKNPGFNAAPVCRGLYRLAMLMTLLVLLFTLGQSGNDGYGTVLPSQPSLACLVVGILLGDLLLIADLMRWKAAKRLGPCQIPVQFSLRALLIAVIFAGAYMGWVKWVFEVWRLSGPQK